MLRKKTNSFALVSAIIGICPAGVLADQKFVKAPNENWHGFHVGINASSSFLTGLTISGAGPNGYTSRDTSFGLFAGYDHLFKNNWLAGVEVGVASDVGGNVVGSSVSADFDTFYTARARLGYTHGDTLWYGTVGYGHGTLNRNFSGAFVLTDDVSGMSYGLGVERFLNDRLSVRLEYTEFDLSDNVVPVRFFAGSVIFPDNVIGKVSKTTLALSYKF